VDAAEFYTAGPQDQVWRTRQGGIVEALHLDPVRQRQTACRTSRTAGAGRQLAGRLASGSQLRPRPNSRRFGCW
jgi:hypothetical protein